MIALPILFWAVWFEIRFGRRRSLSFACIEAFVMTSAVAVLIAEATSVFTRYNILWVSVLWAVCLTATLLVKRRTTPLSGRVLHALTESVRKNLKQLQPIEVICLLMVVGTAVFLFLLGISSIPTNPTDAQAYHIPRAYMYYKRATIHNGPSPYGHFLYLPPLNAILMSQIQIFCGGSDRLFFGVQYSAYLICILAVYQITRQLRGGVRAGVWCMTFAALFPLANSQAVTEQNDLLGTVFCAAACAMLCAGFQKLQGDESMTDEFVEIGITGALALLSKITTGVVLFGFCVAFALYAVARRHMKAVKQLFITALCALLLIGGYWTRNALELNGNFLALGYNNGIATTAVGRGLICVKNLSSTFSGPLEFQQQMATKPVELYCAIFGVDENMPNTNDDADFFALDDFGSPDGNPFMLQSFFTLLAMAAFIVLSIRQKNTMGIWYSLSALCAIAATSAAFVWCSSCMRYMMPAFMVSLPMLALILEEITKRKAIVGTAATLLLVMAMFANHVFVLNRTFQPEKLCHRYYWQAEYRTHSAYAYGNEDIWTMVDTVMGDIRANGYTKIGIDDKVCGPVNICLRPLMESLYEVEFINARFHNELEDPTFVPDAVIAIYSITDIPETITYHGANYRLTSGPWAAYGKPIVNSGSNSFTFDYYVKEA